MADTYSILVVDDDESNLELLSRFVALSGHEVRRADCGSAAIAAVASERPDLVLLDWMMPDLSGIDVLRSIREEYDENALPIIMCTALTESEYVSAALNDGANDFVTKPVDPEVLAARISSQLTRKSVMQSMNAFNRELEETVADRTRKLMGISSGQIDISHFGPKELNALSRILRSVADGDLDAIKTLRQSAEELFEAMISCEPIGKDMQRVG